MELGYKLYKSEKTTSNYAKMAIWCNENNFAIKDKGEYYEIVNKPQPSEKELLEQELIQLEAWLKEHDYIGVKIATGRATASEYADVIAEMTIKANRIDVIKNQLAIANGEIKINVAF